MKVTPAKPDPKTGRVCGSDDSTGAILAFTPTGGTTRIATWTNRPLGNGDLSPITYTAKVAGALPKSTNQVTAVASATAAVDVAGTTITAAANPVSASMATTYRTVNASLNTPDDSRVEIGDPLDWTWEVFSSDGIGDQGGGDTDTVLVLPRNNDGVLLDDALVQSGSYTGPASSSYHGSYSLNSVSFEVEDTTDRATAYYTLATQPTADPATVPGAPTGTGSGCNAYTKWCTVADATPSKLRNATALRVVITAGPTLSTAVLHISASASGSEPGDRFILWPGPTFTTSPRPIPAALPAPVTVVDSTITGTLWWDNNSNRRMDRDEAGLANVAVSVHSVDDAGTVSKTSVADSTTNERGQYSISRLRAGKYVVQVHPAAEQAPATVTTYYGQTLPVEQTYSYRGKYGATAAPQSSPIDLAIGDSVMGVDFGYHQPLLA